MMRTALAWGHEGHQAIADVAFAHLDEKARTAVLAIINKNTIPEITNLVGAATWPDEIRDSKPPFPSGKFHKTAAALNFKARFPDHTHWHFDDYPLEGKKYSLDGAFSKPNDVVHKILACIDRLEGIPSPLKQEEALAYLAHLVGDIHQPLHVACGYYRIDPDGTAHLQRRATSPHAFAFDRGGNSITWHHLASTPSFHHFWDVDMVTATSGQESTLARAIDNRMHSMIFGASLKSRRRKWPISWANDSIKVSDKIYIDPSRVVATLKADSDDPEETVASMTIVFDDKAYRDTNKSVALNQMATAAHDLAKLLNAIDWKVE
jgi:hypothetical protein